MPGTSLVNWVGASLLAVEVIRVRWLSENTEIVAVRLFIPALATVPLGNLTRLSKNLRHPYSCFMGCDIARVDSFCVFKSSPSAVSTSIKPVSNYIPNTNFILLASVICLTSGEIDQGIYVTQGCRLETVT